MFVRYLLAATLLVTTGAASADAANWFRAIGRDFKRNNCWPEPFVEPARSAARAPFALMIANGWRLQHTLSDHHFNTETARLNEAGELKVREILTEAPPEFRTLFVLRATDPEVTALRLESAQEAAGRFGLPGDAPSIVEVNIKPRGWSAEDIDATGRAYRASMPEPRIPGRDGASAGK